MTNQKKYLITSLAVLFISVYLYSQYESDFNNGYHFVAGRGDDLHIKKDGKTVINSTIFDLDATSEYVVGLRLPAEYLECNSGYKIRLINKKEYFILSTQSGDVFNFISRDDFEARLKKIGILNTISLDYTKFESVWGVYSKYYEDMDFSTCRPISDTEEK